MQVDNYIYTGCPRLVAEFEESLSQRFHIGELKQNTIDLYGCDIQKSANKSIRLTQRSHIRKLSAETLTVDEKSSGMELASPKENRTYQSVIGSFLFVGRLSRPVALYHASHLATNIKELRKHHLKELQSVVKAIKKTTPEIAFLAPAADATFKLDVYSDAAMPRKTDNGAKGGVLIVRRAGDVIHPIYWQSLKLRMVARSSTTAELIAAADGLEFALHLRHILIELEISPTTVDLFVKAPLELTVDSRSLFSLVTSSKQPEEARNRADLAAIRETFAEGSLRGVNWCPGYYLTVDALTKNNRTSAAHLLKTFKDGRP